MADAFEDALNHPAASPDGPDLEDEVQDFRFLLTTAQAQKLPSRGIKDFEPHGTNLQQATLEASREAMHMALNRTRIHNRNAQRAIYDEVGNGAWVTVAGGAWAKNTGRVKPLPKAQQGEIDAQESDTELVDDQCDDDDEERTDPAAQSMVDDSTPRLTPSNSTPSKSPNPGSEKQKKKKPLQRIWLLPEEALWLIERGSIEIRWPAEQGQAEDDGLPMSLQAAYAAFLGMEKPGGLTLEEHTVYQYLRRCGFIVLRARDNGHNVPRYTPAPESRQWPAFGQLWKSLFSKEAPALSERGKTGPLVQPGLYRSYDDIFRMLNLVSFHDPKSYQDISSHCNDPNALNVTYHIYKPKMGWKKTAPGPPDFYISVLNARQTLLPTEPQFDGLLRQTPYHPPDQSWPLNKKLKEGYRNVILAVVDQGVISMINVSDAGFGHEKLWGRTKKSYAGAKRGGRGGGMRGRGRGRGRGK